MRVLTRHKYYPAANTRTAAFSGCRDLAIGTSKPPASLARTAMDLTCREVSRRCVILYLMPYIVILPQRQVNTSPYARLAGPGDSRLEPHAPVTAVASGYAPALRCWRQLNAPGLLSSPQPRSLVVYYCHLSSFACLEPAHLKPLLDLGNGAALDLDVAVGRADGHCRRGLDGVEVAVVEELLEVVAEGLRRS